MVRLNLDRILFLLLLFVSTTIYSQKVNLIIFINDEIMTSSIGLEFHNKTSAGKYEYIYSPGREIDISTNDVFKENMILQFDAYSDKKDPTKLYNYKMLLKKELFHDTSFLIIRIYNLDVKKYKKIFCRSKESYVVDFHKSSLYINTSRCK
ncbi:hypothetical protein [Chryseobacterium sp. Mn2064]|uniref:hypothetical protein n=1 Tax=Chryseobacterium sp. Mn2064 TaxID=3395263 RepID=UPI003BE32BBF